MGGPGCGGYPLTAEAQRRAWVSFTQADLSECAAAVTKALKAIGWVSVRADHLPSASRPVMEEIRRAIAGCQALIVLVAHRYGGVPSPEQGGDGTRSWVWLEVLEAERRDIPILAFILDDRAPWPLTLVDRSTDADRLQEFKSYLGERRLYKRFSTAEELAAQVVDAVRGLTLERGGTEPAGERPADATTPPVAVKAEGGPPAAPLWEWEKSGVDPLELAWRLVVDGKARPDLLLHLHTGRMREALEKLVSDMGPSARVPGTSPLPAMLAVLKARQGGLEPNALWIAWMRQVHRPKVEALKRGPAADSPDVKPQ